MSDFEYIIKELKAKRFELAVLEQKIKNCRFLVSPQFRERIQGGKPTDLEEKYAKYNQFIREYREKEAEISKLEIKFNELIDNLTEVDDKMILSLFYLQGLSLFSISQKMNFSYGYVRVRKSKATKKLKQFTVDLG